MKKILILLLLLTATVSLAQIESYDDKVVELGQEGADRYFLENRNKYIKSIMDEAFSEEKRSVLQDCLALFDDEEDFKYILGIIWIIHDSMDTRANNPIRPNKPTDSFIEYLDDICTDKGICSTFTPISDLVSEKTLAKSFTFFRSSIWNGWPLNNDMLIQPELRSTIVLPNNDSFSVVLKKDMTEYSDFINNEVKVLNCTVH